MKTLIIPALLLSMFTTAPSVSSTLIQKPLASLYSTDEKDLEAYAGTYTFTENDTFQKLTITVEKGDLYAQVDGNERYKLLKQPEPDTYKSTSSYGSIFTFTRDANTKIVTGFKMKIMDNNLEGTKDKK